MNVSKRWIIALFSASLSLPVFAKAEPNEEDHVDHEENSDVSFTSERGLRLTAEIREALGIKTSAVAQQPVRDQLTVVAQVFATTPEVLASATVPKDQADKLIRTAYEGAKSITVRKPRLATDRLIEVDLNLGSNSGYSVGDFVNVHLASTATSVVAVPTSAILDSATGPFVYLAKEDHYRRVALKVGAQSEQFTEIIEGLHAGDVIVRSPVESLWLIELRLTKGGGHAH